ncbi:MAG: membrane protein insertion efficiency factor YidD [Rubrivivax sp.]|jgi:putative membrane protein insertion efficiency factor|nr:membrane protein insertion efficiency factor YidD [Rubrivivax sp.]
MQFAQKLLIGAVQAYRLLFKAWLGPVCRFEPSCSAYALEALQRHGAGAGSYLAARRLLRCHPWCDGGHDPVPAMPPGLFTSLPGMSRGSHAPSSTADPVSVVAPSSDRSLNSSS